MKIKKGIMGVIVVISLLMVTALFILRPDLLINPRYKMMVFVTVDSNDVWYSDSVYPRVKKWFDASQWLKQPQYIKLTDIYLLNTQFKPITTPTDFGIKFELYEEIQHKKYGYPYSNYISEEESTRQWSAFSNAIENKIKWEYVYSKFDEDALIPTIDYFLISFTYNGKGYETLMMRVPYNDNYLYTSVSSLYKEGEWYKKNADEMTYKKYLAQQTAKQRQAE